MRRLLAFGITLVVIASGAAQAEPLKIRMHWATAPGHWAPMIARTGTTPGVHVHYGKSYIIDPIFIAGSGPALQALAANELDITGLSPQSISIGINEAKLPLKVIGQQFSTDVPGYAGSGFWVRKDEIKKVEDLKGKVIGVNARGSTIDAAVRTMLARHNMEDGKDYQVVELRFPAQLPALQSKRVDLAILLRPFDTEAAKDPSLKELFTMGDALGPSETITFVGKADYIAKNRAAVVDMLEDNIRLRRWAASSAGHDQAVKFLAEVVKKPAAEIDYAFTKNDNYYDPNAKVNVERLQKNIDDLVKIKLINQSIDAKAAVDPSLAEEAAKRVGPLTN
jgi:ABC-type nitrate/sulfonate/bicarbonate transport system substrate-binding protein